jgi:hypothetical protein
MCLIKHFATKSDEQVNVQLHHINLDPTQLHAVAALLHDKSARKPLQFILGEENKLSGLGTPTIYREPIYKNANDQGSSISFLWSYLSVRKQCRYVSIIGNSTRSEEL